MKRNFKKMIVNRLLMVVIGQLFILGFISGLEFVSPVENLWLFILLLVGMHVGIVLFILSKKLFKIPGKYSRFYNIFYILLIPFLSLMGIKIAKIEMAPVIEYSIVFSYVSIVLVISIVLDVFYLKEMNKINYTKD